MKNMKRRNPTKSFLVFLTAFYFIAALARWYFFFRPAYTPRDIHISWLSILAQLVVVGICMSLMLQSRDRHARLFWGVMVADFLLGVFWKSGLISGFAQHIRLLGAINFTVMACIVAMFLILYKRTPYNLFECIQGKTLSPESKDCRTKGCTLSHVPREK